MCVFLNPMCVYFCGALWLVLGLSTCWLGAIGTFFSVVCFGSYRMLLYLSLSLSCWWCVADFLILSIWLLSLYILHHWASYTISPLYLISCISRGFRLLTYLVVFLLYFWYFGVRWLVSAWLLHFYVFLVTSIFFLSLFIFVGIMLLQVRWCCCCGSVDASKLGELKTNQTSTNWVIVWE